MQVQFSKIKIPLLSLFSIALFIGLFPWIFSHKGELFGFPISIRALGDTLGVVFIIYGLLFHFSKKVRESSWKLGQAIEQLPPPLQRNLIIGFTLTYLVGIVSHKLRAQHVIGTHAFDLGFFSNICWNTANGNWFYCSELERNFMGVHVNWILWPLSIFYWVLPGAHILLIAQAVILGATIPILWKLVQEITGSFIGGLMAAMLFACSPYINHTISNDFHPDVWQVPCLVATLWCWKRKHPIGVLGLGLLALLAKEDVSVVLCGFALILLMQKEWRITGTLLMSLSLGAFVFHTQIFTPRFLEPGEQSLLFSRYPLLGSDYHDFLKNIFVEPGRLWRAIVYDPMKYVRLFCYLLPVGGLVLLAPIFLIPPFISVLPHVLSQASTQLNLADIYSLPSQAFLFVGAAYGALLFIQRFGEKVLPTLIGMFFIIGGIGVLNSPRFFRSQTAERIKAFHELTPLIPKEASVAAQQNIQPHFDGRRFIQLFPIGPSMPELQRHFLLNPDYVVCDRIGNALPYDGPYLKAAIASLEQNEAYTKIFEKENFLVFQRKTKEPPQWATQL